MDAKHSPDVINWVANQVGSLLVWFIGGIVALLAFLGKNFWQSQVVDPQAKMKEQITLLQEKQEAQGEKINEMESTLAVIIEQNKQAALHQSEQNKKLDMLLEIALEKRSKK